LSKVAGREDRSRAKRRSLEVREEFSRQGLWERAKADARLRQRYERRGSDLCVRICVNGGMKVACDALMPVVKEIG
jgi:hypothetical protein